MLRKIFVPLFFTHFITIIFISVFFIFSPKVFAETHITEGIGVNTTWDLNGSPYIIDNDIYFFDSPTLTIEPGVIVRFAPYAKIILDQGGSINAVGTDKDKIIFTNLTDDNVGGNDSLGGGIGAWPAYDSLTNLNFKNTIFHYLDSGLHIYNIPNVTISNSLFEKNNRGIYDEGKSKVNISNTEFKDNNLGIYFRQSTEAPGSVYDINNLSIHNNSIYGVQNEVFTPVPMAFNWHHPLKSLAQIFTPSKVLAYDYLLDFRNTWWGDNSGPKHDTLNTNGLGNKVSDNVIFDPWMKKEAGFSNVLFLPGIEASRLYKQKTVLGISVEDQLWEPNANSDVEDLYMNPDGTSKSSGIYTRDIINESNTPFDMGSAGLNVYKSFSKMMDQLVADKKITEWRPFAYDWRFGVDEIVKNGTQYQNGNVSLVDTLQSLINSSKNGKVTIIAHSNGGLLAKALLKKLQDDKNAGINNLIDNVDVLILVASPEIGTASAVPVLLHGYEQAMIGGLLMDEIHAREVGRNMLGAYGLLPSKEYLNRVSASPVTFSDSTTPSGIMTKFLQSFGSVLDSYAEYKSFLFGGEGRVNPNPGQISLPIVLSPDLFSKAENLHNNIDNWTPPKDMKVIEVAGWGIDTIASFEYYPICGFNNLVGCVYEMDERPRFTADGDGTVVEPSAHYMSLFGSADKYWVDLFKINNDKFPLDSNKDHKNIFETQPILGIISNTIQKVDLPNSKYISMASPIDTKNRLRLSIHSPVTLDAYDAQGNHTGKICPQNSDFCYAEESIPNSSYLEFGEGKYLNLPEDQLSKIKLLGTDVGTFTYNSEKVLPNGTSSISSFVDIPVTTQTEVEITLDKTNTPQLALDVTGDGKIDFTLKPNDTFDPIIYLQVMKATIDSLDIPQARIKAFDTRVENIIKSIQKGKIDKAKLKADRFKNVLEKKLAKPDPKHPKIKRLSKTDAQLLLDMLNKLLDNLN